MREGAGGQRPGVGIMVADGAFPPVDSPFHPGWLRQVGMVAASIGVGDFHERLLSLVETLIPHQSSWIISYSSAARPDVLYTAGVPAAVRADYTDAYRDFDPFWRQWQRRPHSGVVTLQTLDASVKSDIYTTLFQTDAGFADELAVVLPALSGASVTLFLQRSGESFAPAEIEVARRVFPVLEGLHRAHVGRLFVSLRQAAGHAGYEADRLVRPARDTAQPMSCRISDPSGRGARVEPFDADFSIERSGRLYVLERAGAQDASPAPTSELMRHLTPREREILSLILQGLCTGEIAQALRVGKGTVKNHRMRLYRKAQVSSERALVALFRPVLHPDG
ncbi:helix-turn-helix transcriptional regulator [Gluconacetobacter tumulisoli]|uniref:Helix-turn-helix transcriptional regulator n=1 Tax=Gluconacetobacter tumulisoli TaxID=1286189 RepID=A0A7W4PNQ8_9PROT|nr:helix-turn-helix transcriptional regulator [Gluconacetobacter tumulisoli]MBB2201116.1 helix-turn-helix transcriptional regulator [Gluconacetobacter tumulisoli]